MTHVVRRELHEFYGVAFYTHTDTYGVRGGRCARCAVWRLLARWGAGAERPYNPGTPNMACDGKCYC